MRAEGSPVCAVNRFRSVSWVIVYDFISQKTQNRAGQRSGEPFHSVSELT